MAAMTSNANHQLLPYNVKKIQLKPSRRIESATSQSNNQLSSVKVLISWFPLPASGKAYVKCKCPDIAQNIVHNLIDNYHRLYRAETKHLYKNQVVITLYLFSKQMMNLITVRIEKKLEECCTAFQVERIAKNTVPPKPSPRKIIEEMKTVWKFVKNFVFV